MARTVTYVSTDELRDWARENEWTDEKGREVSDRGRVSTKLINDFNKANKRYFKQYSPISRQPQQPAGSAPAPSTRDEDTPRASSQRQSAPRPRESAPAPAVERNTVEDSNGVNSLSEVIAMLQAAEKRGGKGRPVVVTIQALVNV